jgi:hypothetical protein
LHHCEFVEDFAGIIVDLLPFHHCWTREPRINHTATYSRVIFESPTMMKWEQVDNDSGEVLDKFTVVQRTRLHDNKFSFETETA